MSGWTFETETHTQERTWGVWDDEGSGEVVCQHVQTLEHARLIASAPKLLAALDRIFRHAYDEDTPVEDIKADFDRMRDTAAKAIDNATKEEA